MKKILVTCALPYANGPIHLGHLLENIQADIWVRHQRLLGNIVYFICADDSHGTPILLKSIELGLDPEIMINNVFKSHIKQFKNFNIIHDFYFTTHSKYNYKLLVKFLFNSEEKKILYKKNILQYYDLKNKIYLPDRYIKGTCFSCMSINQFGDGCEVCGLIYNANKLINPISLISNESPVLKLSEHLFVKITIFKNILKKWIDGSLLNINVKNQLFYWLDNNLNDWNISRDKPYFGFKIPKNFIKNKYYYVWLDATLGYISTFNHYFIKNNFCYKELWKKNSDYELYNFLGKDVLYFHGIYWPILLEIMNYRKPDSLVVHGHLKINGLKMSKSKNNFISSETWLKNFDSDSFRYYISSMLSNNMDDINMDIEEFVKKINSDLVNKFLNIASRISFFLRLYFSNYLSSYLLDVDYYNFFVNKSTFISNLYIQFNYSKVISELIDMFGNINNYINRYKPWLIVKINKNNNNLHMFCTMILNIFKIISVYLFPIIPMICKKIEFFLNTKLTWNSIYTPLLCHKINDYDKIYKRIDNSKKFIY